MEGLLGLLIASISSEVPPAVGVQSIQPTLPGPFLQSGRMYRTPVVYLGPPGSGTGFPLPSQETMVTGTVTGRMKQPADAEHVSVRYPARAVASAVAVSWANPMARIKNVSKVLEPRALTP